MRPKLVHRNRDGKYPLPHGALGVAQFTTHISEYLRKPGRYLIYRRGKPAARIIVELVK